MSRGDRFLQQAIRLIRIAHVTNGAVIGGPATERRDAYELRESDGHIEIRTRHRFASAVASQEQPGELIEREFGMVFVIGIVAEHHGAIGRKRFDDFAGERGFAGARAATDADD